MAHIPRALTIAGSDSGGGAGIQADLKTFAALGVYGMSVITSVTAQDTRRVYDFSDVPSENIRLQMDAVLQDIGVDAVKTGMLSCAETVRLVAHKIRQYGIGRVVVDPVMVSTGGDPLLRPDAADLLKSKLFPCALLVTPNLREAEILTGRNLAGEKDVREAAAQILGYGPRAVLIKGGHFEHPGCTIDYLFEGEDLVPFRGPRIETRNTHGSGCTLSSAITACLACGFELREATARAKEYVTEAIRHALALGSGHGPLDHFWKQRQG